MEPPDGITAPKPARVGRGAAAPTGCQNGRMKFRTGVIVGFAAGYVLGAKAGRDRYEQIRKLYRRATSNEQVQKLVDQGRQVADSGTARARDVVSEQLSSAGRTIRDQLDRAD
jgi:gas vesicle protein